MNTSSNAARDGWRQRLRGLDPQQCERALQDLVLTVMTSTVRRPFREWDAARPFRELGVAGGSSRKMRVALTRHTGVPLRAAVLLDHPTPRALAGHLAAQLAPQQPAAAPDERAGTDPDEPIAIIGVACRYPGHVRGPEDLWRLVDEGRDGVSAMPDDRGWHLPHVRHPLVDPANDAAIERSGFIDEPGHFDAAFFGIGDDEATATDPQQRLMLELSWEAVERARIDPLSLRGTQTSTFLGVAHQDYLFLQQSEMASMYGCSVVGGLNSSLSGRVSYALGLEGPAVTLDTACSSSLVAVHVACQSLRRGETPLALVGGVSVQATPVGQVEFARFGALARDGRSRSFSEHATGFALSEGAGVLVLERLDDALRNGHPVLAVVRGSAVNQDGTSNGMTVPNGPAQERLIRTALAGAGLSPYDVDVLEAHSPGTLHGDPVEVRALQATYARDRSPDRPLLLGTMKSNIGHTLAAAGAGGIIKMIMAMQHGSVPRTLHAEKPSTLVDWSSGTIRLVQESTPWPETGRPRRAGVSSFGLTGTNAHVILERDPRWADTGAPPAAVDGPDAPVPWVLSAATPQALRDQAARLRDRVAAAGPVDVGWSLATTRASFEHRAVIVAADRPRLLAGLDAIVDATHADTVTDSGSATGGVVLLLDGGAGLGTGAAAYLHRRFGAYARALAQICAASAEALAAPLTPGAALTGTGLFAGFARDAALLRLVQDWGLRPDVVVAGPGGTVAAASATGVLPVTVLWRVLALRAAAAEADTAGDGAGAELASKELHTLLADLQPGDPLIPLAGTASGPLTGPDQLTDPQWWYQSAPGPVVQPVGDGITLGLGAADPGTPGWRPLAAETSGTPIGALLAALAAVDVRRGGVQWAAVFEGTGARTVDLPTYAFQRRLYWCTDTTRATTAD